MKSNDNYNGFKGIFKFISTAISWTALVILIIVALFLAYYTITTKLYESTGDEKYEPIVSLYTIISPSMTPNINVYDVVVTKKISKPTNIKVGDVITFTSTSSISRGMIITHRVVEVGKTDLGPAYKTKGDNNLSPDSSPAEFENVIGKVIFRIPALGRVQFFLSQQGGWIIAIVIPALFIIISDILKIFKLTGVKNKIEKIDAEEKKNKKEQARQEELRKEILKRRLNLVKDTNEPDPIVTKKPTKIVVAETPKKKAAPKKQTRQRKKKR